tara:strand:+ start:971 stop:2101 length:1131 start_codon:yes stop_codon:yes gene_type:complete
MVMYFSNLLIAKIHPPIKLGIDSICGNQQDLLIGKKIGLITNQSGVTSLGESNISCLKKIPNSSLEVIFSPEHGFFGNHPAGEKINGQNKVDSINVISLYGSSKKPTQEQLKGIDILIYDIQDIGARCYTYISTLGLAMEAAAEANITFMVLDRPNPITTQKKQGANLNKEYTSFLGPYPIPLRYGLTPGQLAKKINQKKWIPNSPELIVVKLENWSASKWYDQSNLDWIAPSPNIPDLETALLYTATVIFEATNISEGRGTETPFLAIGAPWINGAKLANEINRKKLHGVTIKPTSFTPKDIKGKVKNPKYKNQLCEGIKLTVTHRNLVNTEQIAKTLFFSILKLYPTEFSIDENYLNKLWGTSELSDLVLKAKS